MKRKFFVAGCFIFSFLFLLQENVSAQCVVINEILANGAGPCDGSCSPNTEEWTELYNTCAAPTDISCYVMTDGDFTVTFPSGTIIPANGYFVIGSINSGGTVDIDLGTCGCTSGTSIGVFTNGGEQVILLDPIGNIVDAVYWGSGQFPVSIGAPPIGSCAGVTVNISSATSSFSALPTGGANGCSVARVCDGASTWEERCGALVSMHSTNGIAAIPDFTVTDSIICTGSCLDFTDLSSGTPTAWNWSFPGSSTASSTLQNPTNICYPTAGNYDVTLSMTNACGTFTDTKTAYIQVSSGQIPVITANGSVSFCSGGSVVLQTTTVGALQWMLNGTAINGASNQTYTATASGTYTLNAGSGNCSGVSNAIVVNVVSSPVALITPQGSTTICAGGSVTLDAGAGFNSYQWLNNGTNISGATNQTYTANAAGSFQVIVSNATGCLDTSVIVSVTSLSANPPTISSSIVSFSICSGQNLILSVANTFTTYQWYLNAAIISGATNANYTTSTAGNYFVIISTGGSCIDTSLSVTVSVLPSPTAVINPVGPTTLCLGNSITLQSNPASTYQWLQNGTTISGATNNSFNAISSGSYAVIINDNNSCSDTSTASTVTVSPPINIQINASANGLCEGETSVLSLNNSFPNTLWSTTETTSQILVAESGNYSVLVTDASGCTASDSINITFYSIPTASAGPDINSNCNGGVVLEGSGNGSFSWSPSTYLNDATSNTPLANPSLTTTYTLTVINGNCVATDEVVVIANCGFIAVPNAFSPNDDGRNDFFRAIGNNIGSFQIEIFDRWGELVFESNTINEGWDGKFNNSNAAIGVYVWLIKATDNDGNILLYQNASSGNVTLLR